MDIQRLITMANQIGDFYGSYPNKTHAEQEIAGHLNKFWALSMRKQIADHVAAGGVGLQQVVEKAVKNHLQT